MKTYFVDGVQSMWQQLNEFARSHTNALGQEQLEVIDGELPPGMFFVLCPLPPPKYRLELLHYHQYNVIHRYMFQSS